MRAGIRSEVLKLLTVRSTYILLCAAAGLTILFNFLGTSAVVYESQVGGEIIEEEQGDGSMISYPDPSNPPVYETITETVLPKEKLLGNISEALSIGSLFVSITVVLFVAHEFRYNTINYSLTSTKSRSKFLLAKLLVATGYVLIASLILIGVSAITTYSAVAIKGLSLPAQEYHWLYLIGRMIFGMMIGYALIGFAITALVRNITAGIAAILVLPTLDAIGAMLLSARNIEPTKFLPFSALDRVGAVVTDMTGGSHRLLGDEDVVAATVLQATFVGLTYVIGLLVIAWVLFVRRDAN